MDEETANRLIDIYNIFHNLKIEKNIEEYNIKWNNVNNNLECQMTKKGKTENFKVKLL